MSCSEAVGAARGNAKVPFSGSYRLEDCQFLLTPLAMEAVSVTDKERLIQSGARHYSEMLTPEELPSPQYLALFEELALAYAERIGRDIVSLAAHIARTRAAPFTVVSLARAGTPVGVLLTRGLRAHGDVRHYSISIIRDRGIDENALRHILRTERRPPHGIVFVDGWTAKGVIGAELRGAIGNWNARHPEQLDPRLYVLSDIGGTADVAASFEDYAIPSGILNATVSGLVSRSILDRRLGAQDFHGCVFYESFAHADRSNWFVELVAATFGNVQARPLSCEGRTARASATTAWLLACMREHAIADINLIKPGVAEATRVFLRRVPACLIVRDPGARDVRHLLALAQARGVPVEIDAALPFLSAALIRSLRGASSPDHNIRSQEP
jgi:hypothetical protein